MNTVSGQQISSFEASFTTHKTSPSWNHFKFFSFQNGIFDESLSSFFRNVDTRCGSFIWDYIPFSFCICFWCFFVLFCKLLCSFSLSPSRYKNPIDIPLGNSKQKIKSLKARVSDLLLSFEAFFSLHLVHEVSPSSVLLIIWGCYDRHGRRCC